MKAFLTILALGLVALMPAAFAENDAMAEKEMMKANDVSLVVFYSETCSSCKVMEPKMAKALNVVNRDNFQVVKFDFSNDATIEATRSVAAEKNVNSTLQKYGAKTGFAVLVDADGNELAKITKSDSSPEMAMKIINSVFEQSANSEA